ncbi:MAG: transporter substrate-binding domain-containing protein [Pyramidobacter sp.]|nr:transporter substrate-binding domain-containing protein [Pyramidobacter sp.]
MFKRIAAAALIALCLVPAAFAAKSAMEKDTIVVATESTYPPYEYRNEKGELEGFDIEFAEIIAKRLGKKVEWVDMPFDSLIPALMAGKIDLIAAGLSATEERARRVTFSAPYEISFSAFVTKAENPPKDVDEIAGKIVAAQIGTVQETFARSLGNVEVKTFQKFDDCVREVVLGRAAATLMDIPVAKKFVEAKDFKGKVVIAFNKQITGADKALAMSKKDPEFSKAVDAVITEMTKSGELETLRNKWFK